MRNIRASEFFGLAALLLCGAAQVYASPVLYDVDFTAFDLDGSSPTAASFDYDASAPVGSQFSDFDVVWDGFTFHLTARANNPDAGPGPFTTSTCVLSIDSAGFFAALANPSDGFGGNTFWIGSVNGGTAEFGIFVGNGVTTGLGVGQSYSTSYSGPVLSAAGDWTISAGPEPGPLPLLLITALAMLGINRIRALQRDPHRSQL